KQLDALEKKLEETRKEAALANAARGDEGAQPDDDAKRQRAGKFDNKKAAGPADARFGGAVMVTGDSAKIYALMREALIGLEKKAQIRWSAPPERLLRNQVPHFTITTDDPKVIMEVLAVLPKSPDVTGINYAPSRDAVFARRAQQAGENLRKGF